MERTKLGLGVLVAAIGLGVLGDGLLRATPWGINVLLWISALVVSTVVLGRLVKVGFRGGEWWLAPLAVLFTSFVAWRAAPMLVFLNLPMVLVALSLFAVRGRQDSLKLSGIVEYALGGFYTGVCAVAGPVSAVIKDVEWREFAGGRGQSALAVIRGTVIAAPLLLIFGSLFVAADAVFEGLVRAVFDFDVTEELGHLLLAGFISWISAGILRLAFVGREPGWTSPDRPANLSLGPVEFGVVLGLLNVLFLMFVVVQVRYLFGGLDAVSTAGLTYAEYTRRGFFELVAVTALVLPLLLLAHWLFRSGSYARDRFFKVLAGSLLALLLVIMASALYRMWLYLQAFGLTELRFYATAFTLWLFVLFSWFTVAVLLRDQRNRFAYGALLSGFAAVMILNIVNPDSIIARVNVERMEDGELFDPYYLTTLSVDAAPVLLAALPRIGDKHLYEDTTSMPPDERRPVKGPTIKKVLADRYRSETFDWRTWNLSRWQARNLVQSIAASPN